MSFPKLVKAIYSWSGEEPGDLGFIEGDIIQVLNTGDGNWWNGQLKRNKTVGSFPKNFVEDFVSKSALSAGISDARVNGSAPLADDIDAGVTDMVKQLSISQGLEYQADNGNYNGQEQLSDNAEQMYDQEEYVNEQEFEGDDPYHSYYASDEDDPDYEFMDTNELPQNLPNTPPVPPPHAHSASVNASPTRVLSDATATPSHDQHLEIDHTPSPLRQAMDGVLETLDHLKEISRDNSVEEQVIPLSRASDRNSMATLTEPGLYESTSDVSHAQSTPSLRISPKKSQQHDSSDEEIDMPFSPDSYTQALNSEFYPMNAYSSFGRSESTKEHSHASGIQDYGFQLINKGSKRHTVFMDRADTYKSVSTAHTASMSSLSVSTTPSSVSNLSATSAGSFARHKFESIHSPDGKGSTGASELPAETPTKLPTDKIESRSSKSLSLKRSAGFLKRLISGRSEEEDPFGQSVQLGRTKSRSSKRSVSSTSSKFKSGLRSLKNFARSKDDIKSLYSRKSVDTDSTSNAEIPGRSSSNWIDIRRDVHRCNTISHNERIQRDRRLEMTGTRLYHPYKALNSVDCESYSGEAINRFSCQNFANDDYSNVDAYILGIRSWPQLMTPSMFAQSKIGRNIQYETERVRAVFNFCAGKLTWRPTTHTLHPQETGDEELKLLSRLMHTRQGNANEIATCFKSMCESIGIICTIVRGHLKCPGELLDASGPAKADHVWNAVVVNGEWRFVDCVLANPTFIGKQYYSSEGNRAFDKNGQLRQSQLLARSDSLASYDSGRNSSESDIDYFYYLTTPLEFIHSHVPCNSVDQHIVPALPDGAALGLPLAGPHSFTNSVELVDFHTGLCKLENLEIAQLNVSVSADTDVWAEILAGNIFNMSLLDGSYDETHLVKIRGLSQAYWNKNQRFFRIKAFLPQPYSQGILNVYVGGRGSQLATKGQMSLAYSMAITHVGSNAPFDFVTRHPTPHCKRQDIYIVQPQCRQLCAGNSYVFEARQHPSTGLTSGSGISRVKIAMQSPSGKVSKMSKKDDANLHSVHGTWEVTVKCYEVGTWRGLVLADSGNAWSVFAEWDCV